ncbi:hypothetical protein TEA_015564 [Camellia sinensis var. sinensis]|uniref:Sulfotransferase domain-containing protein n=1 Tax=Camellia sinensis var. sinensis TaxID=542762 RepID=A0A4S4CXT8_CAMSN|nr:hypothetical protein TEA_015564 [Camellia sinensis var. sinensis]
MLAVAETTLQSATKRPRTITTTAESSMRDAFAKYADCLNELTDHPADPKHAIANNDKRERVVKASRDITINSKKVIFQVHSADVATLFSYNRMSKHNKEEVLEKAEKDLAAVTDQYVARLVKELGGTDFWKLRRAYSPGVQEYVEAATLFKFCKTGTLLNLGEINGILLPLSDPSLDPLQINVLDYLLGLADLTGELMRMAIGRISDGELEYAEKICRFVREIHRQLTLLAPDMDDSNEMKTKMDTMLQSVVKIENAFLIWKQIEERVLLVYQPETSDAMHVGLLNAQDTDILLVTTPKSDTTWLKAILFAIKNRTRYPDMNRHPLFADNPNDLVPFLELKLHVDKQVPDLTSFTSPRLFATHLPFSSLPKYVTCSASKLVYLCRNPMDTFVSLHHFTNKLRPPSLGPNILEDVFDMFCKGVCLYGPFWDHVLGYWKESLEKHQKVLFLKYEEMKEEPTIHLKRLAEFMGCPFSLEEETLGVVDEMSRLCSFDHLSSLEVNKNEKLSSGEENKAFFRCGEFYKRESCSSVDSEEFELESLVDSGVAHRKDNSEMKTGWKRHIEVGSIRRGFASVHVRGSECIALLGSDVPSYSVLGLSDLE